MITNIEIRNCFGIEDLVAELGQIVLIQGKNGAGKTSVINALLQVFEGGYDPALIREGAGEASVEFRLGDGHRFRYSASREGKSYKLEGWSADGTALRAPKAYLTEHVAAVDQVSPGRLLSIDANTKPGRKELRAYLQELLPLSFAPEEIWTATTKVDGAVTPAHREPAEVAACAMRRALEQACKGGFKGSDLMLEHFDAAVSALKETRTRIGGQQREKDQAAVGLTEKVSGLGKDPTEDLASSKQRYTDLMLEEEAGKQVLIAAAEAAILTAKATAATLVAEAKHQRNASEAIATERFNQSMRSAERDFDRAVAKAEVACAEECSVHTGRRDQGILAIREGSQLTTAAEECARLEAEAKEWHGALALRELRDQYRREESALRIQYTATETAIELMEKLRIAKMRGFPIEGLTVDGESIRVHGVEWSALNTAQIMRLALNICAYRAGSQKLLIMDHGEALDPKNLAEVSEACADAGFQLVLARVTDGPLEVKTI